VSDLVTSAKTARESLARGLNALQSDPNVPAQLVELAAPIAQAMGALHQIERSGGGQLMPHAETALNNVRNALAQLQAQPASHPAVAQAMEAVAASLGLVHSIHKASATPARQPSQPNVPPQVVQPAAQQVPQHTQPVPQQPFPQQQAAHMAPQQFRPQQPPAQGFPQAQVHHAPQQPAQAAAQPMFNAAAKATPSIPVPAPPNKQNLPVVDAALGAHSPTNFYKGLSGNDIIDHGGLFVQTYMIPKIGTPVRLRVSLPGGYEFEANAVVQWSREQSDAGNDAPPGFGAKFTDITNEARQLVYRYVRNREPLFHDDL
jgi:hypothetical protein